MRASLYFCSVLFLCTQIPIVQADEVDDLTAKFEAAKERALGPIREQRVELDLGYFDQLEALSKSLQAKGDLEGVVEVRSEREVMKRTGAIGDSESPNLQPLRDNYLEKVEEIETSKSDKEAELNKIYVGELQRLQKELTVAGKIDEALKAKAIAEKLNSDKEETAAVANTSTTSSASPWPVPEPTPEVLEGGKFLKPVVFPEGRHRLRSKIQIGERDPVKPG
ncbi:MAG: hypothetical protein AAGF67_14535, partial [Verrucomicrobiota bacterium]